MNASQSVISYRGHKDSINALCWSPDSQYLASASNDTTVRVWKVSTGALVLTYRGHKEPVEAISWSPQGMHLVSAGWEKTVHVWHVQTGTTEYVYEGHKAWIRKALAWAPHHATIASGSWDSTIHLWHAFSGKVDMIYRGHQSVVTALSWSPDGFSLASGGGSPHPEIQIWETATGKLQAKYQQYQYSIRGLGWSADSQKVAVVGLQEDMRLIASSTGEMLLAYGYLFGQAENKEGKQVPITDYGMGNLVWSPQGKYLATAVGQTCWSLWNAETGENLMTFPISTEVVSWSPDGKMIACANDRENTISLYQM